MTRSCPLDVGIALALAMALSACSRDEAAPETAPATGSGALPAMPPRESEPVATVTPDTPVPGADRPGAAAGLSSQVPSGAPASVGSAARPEPVLSPTPSADAGPARVAKTAGNPAASCGDKPLPPCPLAAWMKGHTAGPVMIGDFDALALAFQTIVSFAPPGYTNWVSIARDGEDAARAQSLDGVKAACRGCHKQYKDRYRAQWRGRPL